MAPNYSHFRHRPLDLDRTQIRLFRLVSKPSDSTIRGDIQIFDFDKCPAYQAVSYTWGPPNPTRNIYITDGDGDKRFVVRENLWQFLRQQHDANVIRGSYYPAMDDCMGVYSGEYSDGYIGHCIGDYSGDYIGNCTLEWFWIDQICIDQSTTNERNHQVRLMSRIFSQAYQVLVWLGPAADGSDQAMDAISSRQYSVIQIYLAEIQNLFQRPYWYRLWILQEVIMARQAAVLCGSKMFPWTWLQDLYMPPSPSTLVDPDFRQMLEPAPASLIREKALVSSSRQPGERLGHILRTFAGMHCQDPRDKVFGLLGLVRPSRRITVDYSMTVKEVFFAAVGKIFEDESCMGVGTNVKLALGLRSRMGLRGSVSSASLTKMAEKISRSRY